MDFTLVDGQLTGRGNDRLVGVERGQISGGAGANMIDASGFSGATTLDGGMGDDSLMGGSGVDFIRGNGGNDHIEGGAGNDILDGQDGDDDLIGGDDDDRIMGGAGSDTLEGDAGNDDLNGEDDDDMLMGGDGDDSLDGGQGMDEVMESGDNDFMLTDTSLSGSGNDDLAGIEMAHLTGGAIANTLNASSFSGSSTLDGGAGNDSLMGGSGADDLIGGDDDDMLDGGAGDDSLEGNAGNDDLHGGDDDDMLMGGTGSDSLEGNGGNDDLNGEDDDDMLSGGDGDDSLDGGLGMDEVMESGDNDFMLTDTSLSGSGIDDLAGIEMASITGGASANTLNAAGFSGSATLDGGAGNDSLMGGSGADDLIGGDDDDMLDGGAGDDSLSGDAGNDDLHGGSDNDSISGGAGTDSLSGDDGDDDLNGEDDDDLLRGGNGEDHLDGGNGRNLLDGDAGIDFEENGLSADVDQKLVAELTSAGAAQGTAEFEQNAGDETELELQIEVEDATPGMYDVLIGGVNVGQITVESDGRGRLKFSNDPNSNEEVLLPQSGLSLTTGTAVEVVGVVSGTFAYEGETASGQNGQNTELSASLTSGGSATGRTEYEVEFEDGVEQKKFEVRISNAAASTTFDVSIDSVVVGQITTDASGRGKLEFNSSADEADEQLFPMGFTDPTNGSVIDVGGVLTGTLA